MAVSPQRTGLVPIKRRLVVVLFSLLFGKLKISWFAKPIFLCTTKIEAYGLILKVCLEGARIPMTEKKSVAIILSICIALSLEPFVVINVRNLMFSDCSVIVYTGLS
jgi:hypothetical protein